MTDTAYFDSARFDYARFDCYFIEFDKVKEKLEILTRSKGELDPSTAGSCRAGYFRAGATIPNFESLKNKLERLV